jgi:hypothetical protein
LVTRFSKNLHWLKDNGFDQALPLRTLALL